MIYSDKYEGSTNDTGDGKYKRPSPPKSSKTEPRKSDLKPKPYRDDDSHRSQGIHPTAKKDGDCSPSEFASAEMKRTFSSNARPSSSTQHNKEDTVGLNHSNKIADLRASYTLDWLQNPVILEADSGIDATHRNVSNAQVSLRANKINSDPLRFESTLITDSNRHLHYPSIVTSRIAGKLMIIRSESRGMASNHGSRTLIKHISNTHTVQLMGIGFMRPETRPTFSRDFQQV